MTPYPPEYDQPEVLLLSRSWPVARHVHRCDACRAEITPGTRYVREFLIVDGEATVYKAHVFPCPEEEN